MAHFFSRTKPTNPCLYSILVVESPCLFGARFSAAKVQVCRRIAFLGPGFQPPRFRFVVKLPFWGQVFSHQASGLSSNCLFGARFSAATAQVCRRIAFLGPGFQPPSFRFVVESPFWGRVRSRHGSTLSSTRLAFLGPGFS
jgi:hypothetical protein